MFEDKAVTTATEQNLVCTISDLSENTPITWLDPDNNEISESDTDNYVINQGSYVFGSKASTLTIKTAKFGSLFSGNTFKCKLKSARYPTDSPDVVSEMVLTLLTLGKIAKWKLTSFFTPYNLRINFIWQGHFLVVLVMVCACVCSLTDDICQRFNRPI